MGGPYHFSEVLYGKRSQRFVQEEPWWAPSVLRRAPARRQAHQAILPNQPGGRQAVVHCKQPVKLYQHGEVHLVVPCGKCLICRINASREWGYRILHELEGKPAVFATFTYAEEMLPQDFSVSKREMQLFFKRLRKMVNIAGALRYFCSGEYGEKYGRPHYHAIIFGMSAADKPILEANWRKGLVHVGTVTYDSARYVADYVGKLSHADLMGREPPFRLMSKGLGKAYCDREAERLKEKACFTVGGIEMPLPKYYVDRLGVDAQKLLDRKERKHEISEQVHAGRVGYGEIGSDDIFRSVCASRRQAVADLMARRAVKGKGVL